jgi:hypothetical protein
MGTVAVILSALPRLSLCIGCLVRATGLRPEMVDAELERLGMAIFAHVAICDHCDVSGPVFRKLIG